MEAQKRHHFWLILPAVISTSFVFVAYFWFAKASFYQPVPGGIAFGGEASFANYIKILTSSRELAMIGQTLWVSFKLSVMTLVLAMPLAIVIVRSNSRFVRSFLLLTLAVTFLSGGVTRAYAWLVLLGNKGVINSVLVNVGLIDKPIRIIYDWLGVSIALVNFLLPFAVFVLIGAVKNVPASVEEAARGLGASRTGTFFRITLPILAPEIVVAASLTFSIALSSFLFPLLLGGGRVRMMANYIYERLFVTYDAPLAAATSVVFLGVAMATILIFAGVEKLVRRVGRQ